MSGYRLPEREKTMAEPTPEMIAASAFVAEVDGGGPMDEADRRILRDALDRLIRGGKPQAIFKNQPGRGAPKTSGRNLIVAVYVESRRRFYEQNGLPPAGQGAGQTPLSRAKTDAVDAFDWEARKVTEPASAVQDAWEQKGTAAARLSDTVIKSTLAPWKDGRN